MEAAMAADSAPDSFAQRVRGLLDDRKQPLAELAERAELAASLVSKLLTDTEAARREPRLEHILAIARALELPPRELVAGTTAEPLLSEWLPRTELEEESKARTIAQSEAATLRTELAGARTEVQAMKTSVDQVSQELAAATRRTGDVEATARRERVTRETAEAKLASALVERDGALEIARQNYQAWANARSYLLQLQREVAEAKGSASAGWMAALVGTVGGAILGAAAAEPAASVASRARSRTRRRR